MAHTHTHRHQTEVKTKPMGGALKTQDWKTRHQITGVENAGPENGRTSKLWKAVAVENVQHS